MRQSTVLFLIKSDKNHNLLQNSFVKCLEILLKYVWFPIWTIFGLDYNLFCSTLNFYFTAKEFSPSASENVRIFSEFLFEEFWANSVRCWRMWMLYFCGWFSCFSIPWQPFWLSWIPDLEKQEEMNIPILLGLTCG